MDRIIRTKKYNMENSDIKHTKNYKELEDEFKMLEGTKGNIFI